jgi:hypothetical protein
MREQPTVFQKLKMGAMMGGTVGLCIGLVFGTINILRYFVLIDARYGPGQRGYLSTLATYMGSSAATFGFFMAIGTVIRTQPLSDVEARKWGELREKFRRKNVKIPVYILRELNNK